MKSIAMSPILASVRWVALLTLLGLGSTGTLFAQEGFGEGADLFTDFSLGGFGEDSDEPVELTARYFADASGQGRLEVEAVLGPMWHLYSTTQKIGGPTPTKISVAGPAGVETTGPFVPDHAPAKSISSDYGGLTVEEHEGTVIWSAPIRVPAGFDEAIAVKFNGLTCNSGVEKRCIPAMENLQADFAGSLAENPAPDPSTAVSLTNDKITESVGKPFRDGEYVVEWRASLSSGQLAPGQSGVLTFTAKPDAKFHVYKTALDDSSSSTNFVVTDKDGLLMGKPVANKPVHTNTMPPPTQYYKGKVTWQIPIKVPADATPGQKTIEGMIAYQACTDSSCHRPTALKFTANLTVGKASEGPVSVDLASAKSADALDAAAATKWVDPIEIEVSADEESSEDDLAVVVPPTDRRAFPIILGFAFLGGLILNFMPCVLPVVGLKVMGFVSQAGEDRRRVLLLNLFYVLGIMAVFAVFAFVAASTTFSWGEQFTYLPVRLGLTLMLFALALSYLGVWEIPVPGMAAGQSSQELQSREGLSGAFSKGIFATILATPCSGPLLGYILGMTLGLSWGLTFATLLTVGLGMSFPYIVIGFQPKLVAWLPKPGPWMETLKQLMAFLFLGTVAFFFSQFSEAHKVPVFVSLIAVWFGCWIIGQVPNWAELQKRLMAWAGGIAAATLISMWAFHSLTPNPALAWEDYSEMRLTQLRTEGKTVMVDFGAKWCGTCIYNYETAINTEATGEVIDELDAVAMYADWTDHNQEIKSKLTELKSRSIPLLVIYPGNRPGKPIILRDLVTQAAVVEALREAGASIPAELEPAAVESAASESAAVESTASESAAVESATDAGQAAAAIASSRH